MARSISNLVVEAAAKGVPGTRWRREYNYHSQHPQYAENGELNKLGWFATVKGRTYFCGPTATDAVDALLEQLKEAGNGTAKRSA